MLLSIITVCYNSERTIQRCLSSVEISGDWFEHIIVDGLSSDDTIKIVNKHKEVNNDQKITVISETDDGIFDAYNKGVHLAKGEYILFLNSDDALLCGALNNTKNYLQNAKTTNLSFGNIIYKDSDNQKLTSEFNWWKFVFKGMTLQHPSGLFPRNILLKYKFDKRFRVIGDYDQILRYVRDGGVIDIHGLTTHYMYPGGVSDGAYIKRLKECFWSHKSNLGIHVAFLSLLTRTLIFLAYRIFR